MQCASRLHSLFYLLDLVAIYLKTYIAVLNRNISLGLILKNKRDPAHFQDWSNPGRNKFIPGTARNCPGVITPLTLKYCVFFPLSQRLLPRILPDTFYSSLKTLL